MIVTAPKSEHIHKYEQIRRRLRPWSFTERILNGKFHSLCSAYRKIMYWTVVFSCLFYFNISSGYSWIFSNFWSCIEGCYFTRWCWIGNLVVPEVKSCQNFVQIKSKDFVFQFLSFSYWNLFGPSPYITACIHHQIRILESLISLLQLKLLKKISVFETLSSIAR